MLGVAMLYCGVCNSSLATMWYRILLFVVFFPVVVCYPQSQTTLVSLEASLLPESCKVVFVEMPQLGQNLGFFMAPDKVSILRLDSKMNYQDRIEFKTDKQLRNGNLLAAYRDRDKVHLVGHLADRVAYFVCTYTPGEKPKLEITGIFTSELEGELVAALTYPDKVVALTVLEGTSRINLNIFQAGGKFQSASADLASWVRGLSFTEMLQENKIQSSTYYPYLGAAKVIQKEITNDFRATKRRLKIYTIEDKVVFSLDHLKGNNLAIVGLTDFSVRFNEFKPIPISQSTSGVIKQTSLIYGNSIYMLAMSDQEMAIRVADIYNGKVLNFYLCSNEVGCEIARTPFLRYISKPFSEKNVSFADFLQLVNAKEGFDPALSALRESAEGIELAVGLNAYDPETQIDVTALFKSRLSLDGSVLLAGAPAETAADDAIGYEKLILRPWGLTTQRLGNDLLIGTYNPEAKQYIIARWPLVTGAAN